MFWRSNKNKKSKPQEEEDRPSVSPKSIDIRRSSLERLLRATRQYAELEKTINQDAVKQKAESVEITRDTLPDLLVSQGQVTLEQLEEALKAQRETGIFFGYILHEKGFLQESHLVSFLARYCKIPYLSLLDYAIDKSLISLIPTDICLKYRVLALDRMGRNLTLAMVNPLDKEALSHIRTLLPELRIKPILCTYSDFETVAKRFFAEPDLRRYEKEWAQIRFAKPHQDENARKASGGKPDDGQRHGVSKIVTDEDMPIILDESHLLKAIFNEHDPSAKEGSATDSESEILSGTDGEYQEDEFYRGEHFLDADDIVKEFNSPEELLRCIADTMLDSMHETYMLLKRKVPFFYGMALQDIAHLYSEETICYFYPGETLYKPGDELAAFHLVLDGSVEVKQQNGGKFILSKGSIFAEGVLAGQSICEDTIIATEKTTILVITPEQIKRYLSQDSMFQLFCNIIAALSNQARRLTAKPTGNVQ